MEQIFENGDSERKENQLSSTYKVSERLSHFKILRDREREREREGGKERERERKRERQTNEDDIVHKGVYKQLTETTDQNCIHTHDQTVRVW